MCSICRRKTCSTHHHVCRKVAKFKGLRQMAIHNARSIGLRTVRNVRRLNQEQVDAVHALIDEEGRRFINLVQSHEVEQVSDLIVLMTGTLSVYLGHVGPRFYLFPGISRLDVWCQQSASSSSFLYPFSLSSSGQCTQQKTIMACPRSVLEAMLA